MHSDDDFALFNLKTYMRKYQVRLGVKYLVKTRILLHILWMHSDDDFALVVLKTYMRKYQVRLGV